jgi:hypothetical protein
VHTGFLVGNLREKTHFEDLRAGGSIIIKWIVKIYDAG